MEHNLQDTISLLSRTPATLSALLRDLPETWTLQNEGENTWSAFDIVGHLTHAERTDWMPRVRQSCNLRTRLRRLHPLIGGDTYARLRANLSGSCWTSLRWMHTRLYNKEKTVMLCGRLMEN